MLIYTSIDCLSMDLITLFSTFWTALMKAGIIASGYHCPLVIYCDGQEGIQSVRNTTKERR